MDNGSGFTKVLFTKAAVDIAIVLAGGAFALYAVNRFFDPPKPWLRPADAGEPQWVDQEARDAHAPITDAEYHLTDLSTWTAIAGAAPVDKCDSCYPKVIPMVMTPGSNARVTCNSPYTEIAQFLDVDGGMDVLILLPDGGRWTLHEGKR